MNLFLTGTDTGVGKTYVASLLVRALRAAGVDAVGFKPICCGERDDAELLHAASGGDVPINDINPVWMRPPAAPYTAAMIEDRAVDLALIRETFARLRATHQSVIVEGVGGWLVPIAADYLVRDLAKEFGLPVAVVFANRLGAINHTLLTVESIRASGLTCAGLIQNQAAVAPVEETIATTTNCAIIEQFCGAPLLFDIEYGQPELRVAVG